MIDPDQRFINELARRFGPKEKPSTNGHARRPPHETPDDDRVIELCRKASNAAKFAELFDDGDTSGYGGNASKADFALLGILKFYTQDPGQLDRLMRRSGLMRDKWDEVHYADGRTYGEGTIDNALGDVGDTWQPPDGARFSPSDAGGTGTGTTNSTGTGTTEKSRPRLRSVSFRKLEKPKPRRDLLVGLIPEAHPSMLYGDGGVAKSYIALCLAMNMSAAEARPEACFEVPPTFLGHEVMPGPVGYLDFELDQDEQHRRADRLARGEGLEHPPDDLLYMCALGMKPKDAFGDALELCKEAGAKLLIADSLSVAMAGDVEAARDVIGFYQDVMAPFRQEGIAVTALDHQSRMQAGERYQNKRPFGSVFKTNLARSVVQMEAMERGEDYITLRLRQVKYNFGPLMQPFGVKISFSSEMVTVEAMELDSDALAEEATLNARERVRLALEALGDANRNEIHERLSDLTAGTIKKELSKMKADGEVEETGEVRERQQVVRLTGTGTGGIKGTGTGTGYDALVEERMSGLDKALKKCIHDTTGGCRLCRKNRFTEFYEGEEE